MRFEHFLVHCYALLYSSLYEAMSNTALALCLMDPCLERTFRGHKSYVNSVAFSPNLKQLASGAGDNSIMLWSFKPQLRAFRFSGHKVNYCRVDICFFF
jgi:WD40 repeat protein